MRRLDLPPLNSVLKKNFDPCCVSSKLDSVCGPFDGPGSDGGAGGGRSFVGSGFDGGGTFKFKSMLP